ncbi:MAG: hypothetical protein SYNGOMJ08_00766 [Candidatus Syntrophoarchaeum sp. GoM_oil]|nr:MAG: hypothetical protein SYNGOMJ08_00766 [Candidatus Syntrophoarchaeum sp. GoM_oil]
MELDEKNFDYDKLIKQGTGTHDFSDSHEIICPFDKYEVKVKLSSTNEFIGINEVKINKDFLSHKQKTTLRGFHDVDEFYRE